jgi:hypothetical protein
MDDHDSNFWMHSAIGLLVSLLAGGIFLVAQHEQHDEHEWQQFKVTHSCKVVARIEGSVMTTTGLTTDGKVTTGVADDSDKIGWKCDDGVTYYRND